MKESNILTEGVIREEVKEAKNPDRIIQLARAFMGSHILFEATRLKIFNLLCDAPLSIEEISNQLNIASRSARALCFGLCGLGLLLCKNGRFSNAPEANQFLVSSRREYIGDYILWKRETISAWQKIESLISGESRTGYGESLYQYLQENKKYPLFLKALDVVYAPSRQAFIKNVRPLISREARIDFIDVGCGSGELSRLLAQEHQNLYGVLIDIYTEVAEEKIKAEGLESRLKIVKGDFLTTSWPAVDFVLFSMVLVDWEDEICKELLQKAKQSLKPNGRVLIHDYILGESLDVSPLMSLNYLFFIETQGMIRTEKEWRSLFGSVFEDSDIQLVPLTNQNTLITISV